VFVVAHDWGAQVAWHLCLFRPDRVRAAAILGIPYFPRGPQPMTDSFAKLGDGFYINQFQVELTFIRCSTTFISTHLFLCMWNENLGEGICGSSPLLPSLEMGLCMHFRRNAGGICS
jgi:pimeloyl-ACP methyl ester carboxylesterase